MTTGSPRIQRWKDNIFRVAAASSRRITEPSAEVVPKQRRRIRLLSTFLILMSFNTLVGSLVLKNISGNSWIVLLATSIALLFGYFTSRTRYYRAALILAITIPAVPPLAIAILKPPEVDLAAELMWLAMPLMVSALMLTVRQTIRLALFYFAFIIVLNLSGLMGVEVLAPVMGYLSIITFFVIAITVILRRDRAEIENQLTERQQFEKTLRESEEKYRNLFEYAKEAIILADAQTGILVDINPAGCHLVGLPKEKIVGKHQSGLHPPELVERYKEVFREHVEKGIVVTDDIIIQRADGSQVQCDLSASVFKLGDKQVIQGVFRDVSERKRMEKALRESEVKFSMAFRASPEAISISKLSDGTFLEVNESYCLITGYTREEVIGQNADKFNMWAKAEQREMMLQKTREHVKMHNEELQFRTKSGEIRTMLLSSEYLHIGDELCLLVVSTDITERKQMEESLAIEATRRRILIEQSSDGIVILDQNGAVHEANRRFAEMLGYSSEEILNLNVWDWEFLYPPEQVREMIRTVDEAGDHFKTRHRRKDGTTFDVEISTNGAMFAGQKLIFCVCRDISERTRMEKALRESEEKFSIAFRSSPEMIAIANLITGKYIEVNDSFLRVTGYSREEIIGYHTNDVMMFVNPEDSEKMVQLMKEQGRLRNQEYTFRIKSGEIRQWLCSAEIITIGGDPCIISVATDITERKKMEEALRESEEKFSKAFHTIPESISISTLGDGTFLEVNESYCRNTGFTREEIIGHNADDLKLWVKTDERDRMIKLINELGRIENEEFQFFVKSGDIRTVLLSADTIPIMGESCVIIISNDITERKQAEQKLHQAMTNLEQSSAQLAATNKELEAFSYSVSHDLRSPLRSIDGFSQALLEDYKEKLDETGQDYLKRLRSASQKMGELIDGILKLSRLTRSEMHRESIDLSTLAQEIASRLQETQPKRRVKFIIDKELTANGDPQLLRVLLENLLGNAWKFTSKNPKAKIEFSMDRNNGKKAYFIRDNGAGFDMTYADKLFGAFQRLHEATEFPGTGIGLATVQRIISRHGGTIWAEGAIGKGATFYFTLN